ncbi:hypothetical protein [Methylobacterium soli]|uniref:Uncharacterized protein n=1 Tax=Methylobacterium soli TaxID=553447 RepID=A0A6L3SNL1_9HYPH|nr:hypothetical protein [Methylobacterium soli]KAB1069289.1 hypothetical protein F6X53_31085 [Methylobacterium soli]GJE46545.1 hypothetical protein AEGHOMDF_5751 [Methylobacterium soli]
MARRKIEPTFRPYADETAVRTIGALSFENGTNRIALHGSLDITRDQAGLRQARDLKSAIDAIVAVLAAEDLPEAVAQEGEASRTVKNPFA